MKRFWKSEGWKRIAIVLVSFSAGCAVIAAMKSPAPPIERHTETEMVAPELSKEALRSGGLAILAILTTGAPEGMRQNAAYEIFQGLRASFPEAKVVPRSGAVEKIITADREGEYKAFVKNYEERRAMDPDLLKEWARILGTRYLLIGEVGYADKHTEARMTQTGEKSVAGKVTIFSSGPSMIPEEVEKRVLLHGEIWDSVCGKAVWTGNSASRAVETSGSELARVEDVFISAGRGLSVAIAKAIDGKKGVEKGCGAPSPVQVKEEKQK